MRAAFGEDAENMAWLLFYEFLASYQGVNYIRLPGLVRRFMIFRLMNHITHSSLRFNREQLDQFDCDSSLCQIIGSDELADCLDRTMLADLFKDLPVRQQEVLRYIYLENQTQEQIAETMHCSTRYVRKCKALGLSHIKRKLHKAK